MSIWLVIAAAVSTFVLGSIWYGPLFKKAWGGVRQQGGHGTTHHAAADDHHVVGCPHGRGTPRASLGTPRKCLGSVLYSLSWPPVLTSTCWGSPMMF